MPAPSKSELSFEDPIFVLCFTLYKHTKTYFSPCCLNSCFFCFWVSIHSWSVVPEEEQQSGGSLPCWRTPWLKGHLSLFSLFLTGFPRQDWPSRTPRCCRPSGKKQMLMLAAAHPCWLGVGGSHSSRGSPGAEPQVAQHRDSSSRGDEVKCDGFEIAGQV